MGLFDIFRGKSIAKTVAYTPDAISAAMDAQGMSGGGFLGPGRPLIPSEGYSGNPRAMDYPTGVNLATKSRQQWGGRTGYEMLRELMRSYDLAQSCMNHKIDEIRSMEPMYTPVDDADGDMTLAVAAARRAMAHPDGEHTFEEWLAMWLTDQLTFDVSVKKRRRNNNGDIIGLEIVDGSTVFPYIDENGRRPKPPAPAYFQIIKGLTYQEFTSDDIIFSRFRPQTDSPFGMAPLESILVSVNTDMRLQWHLLQMFTEGSIPAGFMEAPPDRTDPDQVAEWQDYWDALYGGDQSIKHKMIMVPSGSKFTGTTPATFDSAFPNYLALRVCAAFGVVPQDMGLTNDVNRATADTQTDTQFRVNTLPWVRFVEQLINRYLQEDLGLPIQCQLNTGRDKEDRLTEAQAWKIGVEAGAVSADEMREDMYGKSVDNEQPIPRGLISTRLGFTPWSAILSGAGQIDPDTMAPGDGSALPATSLAAVNTSPPAPNPIPTTATPIGKAADGADAQSAELARFKAFAKSRAHTGKWRDFQFTTIAPAAGDLLNRQARASVVKDADPKAPQVGTPKWRQQNSDPTPQQQVDLPLTDHYTPDVISGMRDLWSAADLAAAQTATDGLGDVAVGVYQQTVRQVLAGNVNAQNLTATVKSLWADAYTAGAMSARAQVAGIPVNWDTWKPGLSDALGVHPADLMAALEDAHITIRGITDTTMDRIGSAIVSGVNAGDPSSVTAKAINAVLGDPKRAELIAHTETARMLNRAAMSTYTDLDATQFDLIISEGACEICEEAESENPHSLDDTAAQVPLHPRCLPGSAVLVMPADISQRFSDAITSHGLPSKVGSVTASAVAESVGNGSWLGLGSVTERHYVGDFVTITTELGQELTITPNHPVATVGGWVAAGELHVGDSVLCRSLSDPVVEGRPDVENVKTTIKQVADALPVVFGPVPSSPEDFHGDATNGHVYVVRSAGELLGETDASLTQSVTNVGLVFADVVNAGLIADGDTPPESFGMGNASYGLVGGGGEGTSPGVVQLSHADVHGGAPVPGGDASFEQTFSDHAAADAAGFCKSLLAGAPEISASNIVHLKRFFAHTQVYNCNTTNGWYLADGVVVHNCRCSTTPHVDEDARAAAAANIDGDAPDMGDNNTEEPTNE